MKIYKCVMSLDPLVQLSTTLQLHQRLYSGFTEIKAVQSNHCPVGTSPD